MSEQSNHQTDVTWKVARALLFALPPEAAHNVVLARARLPHRKQAPRAASDARCLAVRVAGLDFPGPVGLAAGCDKNATGVSFWFGLGFDFVEVGTVTPEPQEGNPKPRMFRLQEDEAVINRIGCNSDGAVRVAKRLAGLRDRAPLPGLLGVNLGPGCEQVESGTSVPALTKAAALLAPHADYLTLNLSSPNTPGLRALQEGSNARALLEAVRGAATRLAKPPPVFLKLSPDIDDEALAAIVALAEEGTAQGLVLCNTTTARPAGPEALRGESREEKGGLSGRPLFARSTEMLAKARILSGGKVPLIGVGGVDSFDTAWEKVCKGADLVQFRTGLVYKGPKLPRDIAEGLVQRCVEHGFAKLGDAVGSALEVGFDKLTDVVASALEGESDKLADAVGSAREVESDKFEDAGDSERRVRLAQEAELARAA